MDEPKAAEATYILPIRAHGTDHVNELAQYLSGLPAAQKIVVDGSSDDVFDAHELAFADGVTHVRPDPSVRGSNGKARGVLSGLKLARFETVVVADDDVRYDARALHAAIGALDAADVVRVQNYFAPLPWHAVLDTSRTLINRALDGDWPGTLVFRRSMLSEGYDADTLFENLELVRTILARGGRESVRRDIYVRRLPPTRAHYLSQRVRQAYDEFARPTRLAAALAIVPCVLLSGVHARSVAAAFAICAVAAAGVGYVRCGGYRVFPGAAVALAPVWLLERAACAWLAVFERLRYGGVRYAGGVVRKAASTPRELRIRWES